MQHKVELQKRAKAVDEMLINQKLEGLQPSDFGMHLFNSYAKGEIELEDIQTALVKHYHKGQIYVRSL